MKYQRGAFARTRITAKQMGEVLHVEIGPVSGGYTGMLNTRAYEVRLPGDWPPSAVTVNGIPLKYVSRDGGAGWSFVGNTLTTVIPVSKQSVRSRVTIQVRRADGSMKRRAELDGFAGTMTRLRGAYDALQQMWPVAVPPDVLIDAMQTGDRLSYHPERAESQIAHTHELIPKVQPAIEALQPALSRSAIANDATAKTLREEYQRALALAADNLR